MHTKFKGRANPCSANALICAFCKKNIQAKGIMRALAALYREMAEELENSGLFERRFPPLQLALARAPN
jgi:hypothetical protein